jgi:mRNA interferase MazF
MVTGKGYVPERGDIVWLSFDPRAGHEQAGRRPAVTLSPATYNSKTGLAIFCPVTSQVKGYPFEVALPEVFNIAGVCLADQVKCLDWVERRAEFAGALPGGVCHEILDKLNALLAF